MESDANVNAHRINKTRPYSESFSDVPLSRGMNNHE